MEAGRARTVEARHNEANFSFSNIGPAVIQLLIANGSILLQHWKLHHWQLEIRPVQPRFAPFILLILAMIAFTAPAPLLAAETAGKEPVRELANRVADWQLENLGEMEGIRLTQNAMSVHIGSYGTHFVSLAITIFAFTSVVANYAYAESNLRIFGCDNGTGRTVYTIAYLAMVLWGSGASLAMVWAAADMALGLMTVVNVTALILLTPTIVTVSQDYFAKVAAKREVRFDADDCALQGTVDKEIWSGK